jgi:exodeoxyribonuclease VII small subunit
MPKQMSFEEALDKLEETVRKLEAGGLPLDETVALYEAGTRLAKLCNERLDSAELKISQLVQSPDGSLAEKALHVATDDEAGDADA